MDDSEIIIVSKVLMADDRRPCGVCLNANPFLNYEAWSTFSLQIRFRDVFTKNPYTEQLYSSQEIHREH